MASTSNSNRWKPKNSKFLPKPKQEWRVKVQKRDWLELPDDLMANILCRIGVRDILMNAQKVCTTWCKICKEPAMWRVIHMDNCFSDPCAWRKLLNMYKHAVDRSQGQLVDLTVANFADNELLQHVADRSSRLRRLRVEYCFGKFHRSWTKYLKKFPLLEELNLYGTSISKEDIATAGHCCPMLTTLKVNEDMYWRKVTSVKAPVTHSKHFSNCGWDMTIL